MKKERFDKNVNPIVVAYDPAWLQEQASCNTRQRHPAPADQADGLHSGAITMT